MTLSPLLSERLPTSPDNDLLLPQPIRLTPKIIPYNGIKYLGFPEGEQLQFVTKLTVNYPNYYIILGEYSRFSASMDTREDIFDAILMSETKKRKKTEVVVVLLIVANVLKTGLVGYIGGRQIGLF